MILYKTFILLLTLLYVSVIYPQEADSTESNGSGLFMYPFIFYTPETKLAFGGGGIYFFRNNENPDSRPSKVVFAGFYTTNNQFSLDVVPQLYMVKDKYYIPLAFNVGKYEKKFYGIGNDTPEINNPEYIEMAFHVDLTISRQLTKKLNFGIKYDIEYHDIIDKKNNPYLLSGDYKGSDGGWNSGVGYTTAWDTRDNIFYPTSGGYYEINAVYFSKAFASNYDFNRYLINLRRYVPVLEKRVLAFQAFGSFIGGYPPFYNYSELGGQNVMRGYFLGRFRDKKYYSFQAEFRSNVYWRFGTVVFFGAGDIVGRFSDFKLTKVKYSYGLGIRFMIDMVEKLDVRVDFGFGKDTGGVYFGVEQAF